MKIQSLESGVRALGSKESASAPEDAIPSSQGMHAEPYTSQPQPQMPNVQYGASAAHQGIWVQVPAQQPQQSMDEPKPEGKPIFDLDASKRKILDAICIIAVAIVSSIPLFTSYLVVGHDLIFHLFRIEGLADAIANGNFPAHMQYVQALGYGYPLSICYGDLFLYIPALLTLIGVPTIRAYAIFAILVNFATAAIAYICFKRIFKAQSTALLGVILWCLCPYRIINLYVRCAVGEYLAMTFIPMVALGLYLIFTKRQDISTKYGWVWCGVGAAAIAYSHIITTVFIALMGLGCAIVGLIYRHSLKAVVGILLSVASALLLSLAFTLPLLDFTSHNDLKMSGLPLDEDLAMFDDGLLQPSQLLSLFPPMDGRSFGIEAGLEENMPANVGWALICGALAWIIFVGAGLVKSSGIRRSMGMTMLIASVAMLALSTNIFSWEWAASAGPIGSILGTALVTLQYTFRLLGPASFMFVMLTCLAVEALGSASRKAALAMAFALGAFGFVEGGQACTSVLENAPDKRFSFGVEEEFEISGSYGLMVGEYLPSTSKQIVLSDEIITEGDISGVSYKKDHGQMNIMFSAGSSGGSMILPLFYYSPYEVSENNGFIGEVSIAKSEEGLIEILAAPDSEGKITVFFSTPTSWTVALWVSYGSALALCAYGVVMKVRSRRARRMGEEELSAEDRI